MSEVTIARTPHEKDVIAPQQTAHFIGVVDYTDPEMPLLAVQVADYLGMSAEVLCERFRDYVDSAALIDIMDPKRLQVNTRVTVVIEFMQLTVRFNPEGLVEVWDRHALSS